MRVQASASRTKELQITIPVSAAIAARFLQSTAAIRKSAGSGFAPPRNFGKEKTRRRRGSETVQAFVEHQPAELIQKQSVRNRFRRRDQKYADDRVERSKENQHEVRRRQIAPGSRPRCHGADKEQKQREK